MDKECSSCGKPLDDYYGFLQESWGVCETCYYKKRCSYCGHQVRPDKTLPDNCPSCGSKTAQNV